MRSDDIAISVRNLTKTYRLFGHPGDRIKQFFSLGLKRYHRDFTALKDVSFDIKKGETIGIIGRNGSGKSTLLQLICGILKPTSGIVKVNGRISALLELGAGFNPEFTGRENIYFQGTLMGFTKAQMDKRYDEIAAFADIGEFVDQPVRTYSSGMFVRLAFAVASHVDPEILVIDEALAVGDMAFQKKCFQRIEEMLSSRLNTLLLVSHDLRQIERLCSRVIYLRNDRHADIGGARETCQSFHDDMQAEGGGLSPAGTSGLLTSTGEIGLLGTELIDESGLPIQQVRSGDPLRVYIRLNVPSAVFQVELLVGTQARGIPFLSSASTIDLPTQVNLAAGEHLVKFLIPNFPLAPGDYSLRIVVRDRLFRIMMLGEGLAPFTVMPGLQEFNHPPRLLDLGGEWTIDESPLLAPAPKHHIAPTCP
jgi:ABC-type polysaccharide/polyol phosphate transport system ATPase subunit